MKCIVCQKSLRCKPDKKYDLCKNCKPDIFCDCGKKIAKNSKSGKCKSCAFAGRKYRKKTNEEKIEMSLKIKDYNKDLTEEERKKKYTSSTSGGEQIRTKESIEKMAKTMSKLYKGNGNPFYNKNHSEETKRKMSETRSTLMSLGLITNNDRGRKGWYYSSKNSTKYYYDSLFEKMRMEQLDEDDNVVVWTKRHGIKIDLGKRNFVPDFLITKKNGDVVLEETKGFDENEEIKKNKMIEYCKNNGLVFSWIKNKDMVGYREWLKKQN